MNSLIGRIAQLKSLLIFSGIGYFCIAYNVWYNFGGTAIIWKWLGCTALCVQGAQIVLDAFKKEAPSKQIFSASGTYRPAEGIIFVEVSAVKGGNEQGVFDAAGVKYAEE